MATPKINFLTHLFEKQPKKKRFFKYCFYPLCFLAIFIFIFSFEILLSGESIAENISKINFFQTLNFSVSKDKLLSGEKDDRINILLLGMGGEGHPGPYLTDTNILVSIQPSTKKISMVSIPRDLSVPIPGYGWRKINEANHYGEMKEKGTGAQAAADVVTKVFDQPINYYIRVDFAGFEKLIDELGGIKIFVDNAFTDSQFPTDDYGYQTVSFEQGWQKMNGKTALNYARSRHGNNGESSDFARSKRQQKVLAAIKDRAFAFTTFISYRKISALLNMYKENVVTNLEPWEIYKFYKLAKDFDSKNITNLVLEPSNDSPLYSTMINGAYLLLPKDMSFKQLQKMVKNIFVPASLEKAKQIVKIEIQNGTKIEGLAYRTSVDLKSNGYKIVKIGNAEKQDLASTLIYDMTNGQRSEDLNELKTKLNATLATDKPDWLNTQNIEADFIIILGQNLQSLSLN
ncbi:MAG: LCP family protein [Candidatus Parcubacteria bacterium]|nr:LCP family protein [Candidatus Parcubacteria bacterium]